MDSHSPSHPVLSNNVLVACIPCSSRDSSLHSLEVPFSGLQIKPTMHKEHEDEGRTNTAATSSTDFLRGSQAKLSLQILDSKSQLHRDQLGSLPPGSPGRTEGLLVDIQAWQDGLEGCGFCAQASHVLSTSDICQPHRIPCTHNYGMHSGCAFLPPLQCTCGLSQPKGCLHLSPAVSAVGMFMAGVNLPKPHCRAQHNKLLSSLFLSEH